MNAPSGWLGIGALSQKTRCKVETIRYYEKAGLLPAPARSPGGYRLYRDDQLKRLTFIRRARALGFAIAGVRTLLTLADERRRPCAEVRVVATAHLEEVRSKIADLRGMERVLRETVARCADGRRTDCPLIEALYGEDRAFGSRARPSATRSTA
jgi:MerR family mercuric resistance operon transcriptional regulator